MKESRTILTLAVAALLMLGSGCATKEAMTGKEQDVAAADPSSSAVSAPTEQFVERAAVMDERDMPGTLLAKRLVFFDFDKSVVRDEFIPVVSAHSTFLVSERDKAVILHGHADERGSDEYNLALGQRRADAVKEMMLSSGAFDRQIETVSFGETRPRALGHNESAWGENRRVEIIYTDE